MFNIPRKKIVIAISTVIFISAVAIYWVNTSKKISLENCLSNEPKIANSCLLKITMDTFKKNGYESAYSLLEKAEKEYLSSLFTSSCADSYYFMGQKGY